MMVVIFIGSGTTASQGKSNDTSERIELHNCVS